MATFETLHTAQAAHRHAGAEHGSHIRRLPRAVVPSVAGGGLTGTSPC